MGTSISAVKVRQKLQQANAQAITSIITYIELTTQSALKGNRQLVRKYRDFLSNSQNIALFPLTMDIADHVVELRAKYDFKTPDAIQLGTALACGADYVIANDKKWRTVEELKVIMVEDL